MRRRGRQPAGLTRLGVAAVAWACVAGCSTPPPRAGAPEAVPRVIPTLRIDNATALEDSWYQSGKSALQQGQAQWALLQFEQAAAALPDSARAHNGRVVALARLGRVDDAIRLARHTLARGIASAELSANLALLQQREEPVAAPLASAVRAAPAASVIAAAPVQAAPALTWIQHAPNVLELLPAQPLPAVPVVAAAVVAQRPVVAERVAAVEVSNGAGRSGLARAAAQALRSAPGLSVVRLTNHVDFRVRQTEVRYRSADAAAQAQAVARSLALPARLVPDAALRHGIDVKLVLGSDAAERVAGGQALLLPAAVLALLEGVKP